MGRVPRQTGEARLTAPVWHDGPLAGLAPVGNRPLAWSVRLDSQAAAMALARAPHTDRDLRDFAAAPDAGARQLRRRLTRALVGMLTGTPPGAILFGRTAEGAPSLLSPKGWCISVAGRAPLCLIGVANEPIGVDVEPFDPSPPLWDMLAPHEVAEIETMPAADHPREWLRRWTAKEAHAKRLGYARRADPAVIATSRQADTLSVRSQEGRSRVFLRELDGRIEALAAA